MDNLFDLLQLIEDSRATYSNLNDRFEDGMSMTTKEVEKLTSAWCVLIQRCQNVVKAIDKRLDGVEEAVVAISDPLPVGEPVETVLPNGQEFDAELRGLLDVQSAITLLRHRIESCNGGLIRRLSRLQACAGLGSHDLARLCPWFRRTIYDRAVPDITDLMVRLSASYGLQLRQNRRLREALCALSENLGGVLTGLELAAIEKEDVATVLKRRHTMALIVDCRAHIAKVLDILAESFNKLISPV